MSFRTLILILAALLIGVVIASDSIVHNRTIEVIRGKQMECTETGLERDLFQGAVCRPFNRTRGKALRYHLKSIFF